MSTSSVSSSTTGGAITVSGLGSGLDIADIVDKLVSIETIPQNKLKISLANHQAKVSTYQTLNSAFSALKTASQDLALGLNWQAKTASSTSTNVGVSTTSSAVAGSFTFAVQNLAKAQAMISSGSVSSLNQVIGSGSSLNGDASALGLSNLTSANLSAGSHNLAVTQASSAATTTGNAALPANGNYSSSVLKLSVNGTAQDVNIPAGTYTRAQLVDLINQQSGGTFVAGLSGSNQLTLSTAAEGGSTSIEVMNRPSGSTANSALGLSNNGVAVTYGTSAIVTLDGVSNTIDPNAGSTATINGANGQSMSATIAPGGLDVASAAITSQDNNGLTFQQTIDKINSSNGNYTAAAIQVAPGVYKMQLQAKDTGIANAIAGNYAQYAGTLGSFGTVQDALDASIKVGSGANAYTVTSSTNSMKDVLPGVTLNLTKADPSLDVTVAVGGDGLGLANKVDKLVTAVNDALSLILKNSKYDAASKTGGVFQGNSMTRRLVDQLHNAVSSITGGDVKLAADVGITTNADGTFTFDKTKFAAKYATNPEGVAALFVSGGTTSITDSANPGIAERIQAVAKQATDSVSGFITTSISGENKTIADLNKTILSWDDRLAKKRETLTRLYTSLDTAMSRYNDMSSWLGGQISGLASNSGN